MENLLNNHGVPVDVVRSDIKRSLDESKAIYWQRMCGYPHLWSASTKCVHCGDWWMHGVLNNLAFVCDKCKKKCQNTK